MEHDWLSRKTGMTDPDMGAWSYVYDANGNLTSQADAKAQAINMYYDALNRLKGKTYTTGVATPSSYSRPADPGTYTVGYTYDAFQSGVNYGKGKRTGMTDGTTTNTYIYDARGRQTQENDE